MCCVIVAELFASILYPSSVSNPCLMTRDASYSDRRDTKVQRRNQVLYVLGKISESEFRTNDVENAIRTHLYEGQHDATIGGVANCLAELADGNSAGGAKQILRRTTRGDAYMFIDPLYRMCIRAMLRISSEGKVEKIGLESIE